MTSSKMRKLQDLCDLRKQSVVWMYICDQRTELQSLFILFLNRIKGHGEV